MTILSYKKILMPTDGSDYSFHAGEHAVYLAKNLGSKVYILNVVNVELAFHTGIHYAEGVSELEAEGKKAIDKIGALCAENGVEYEELIIKGQPADAIINYADEIKADCIVIGSIGMSALERALVGSVSEKVMRHAKCPVLMVRKQ